MCPIMLCNTLTRMLNSIAFIDYFQRKLLLQTESCTVQSVEVYSQSSLIAILSKSTNVSCSVGHFLSSGVVLILHKDLDLKIPMVYYYDSQRSRRPQTLLASGNKVLDTFSTIKKMTIFLLMPCYHKNLSAPSFHEYVLVWGTVCVKLLYRQVMLF